MTTEEKTVTWQEYFAEYSDEKLIEYAEGLHQTCFVVECFGTKDLIRYDAAVTELDRRGYDAVQSIAFRKREDDEE